MIFDIFCNTDYLQIYDKLFTMILSSLRTGSLVRHGIVQQFLHIALIVFIIGATTTIITTKITRKNKFFENYDNHEVNSLNMQSIKSCLQSKIISVSRYIFFATTLDKSIYQSWKHFKKRPQICLQNKSAFICIWFISQPVLYLMISSDTFWAGWYTDWTLKGTTMVGGEWKFFQHPCLQIL